MQKFFQRSITVPGNLLSIPVSDIPVVSLIQPNMANGPWIAGGAVIQWYRGQVVGRHDVDVFFRDESQFNSLKNKLQTDMRDVFDFKSSPPSNNCQLIFNSANAETYQWNGFNVQLIKARYYNSVNELLDRFDITACKVATDGRSWYTNHSSAEQHIKNYVLDMEKIMPEMAVKRMFKYWIYGYQPTVDLIERIQQIPNLQNNFANSTDYDS